MPEVSVETPEQLQGKHVTTNPSFSRSARRYTPFGKTPKSRRLTALGLQSEQETAVNLKGLTYTTWRTYKLTPLYNFGTSPRDLKRYSNFLSAHVEAERQKGTFIDTTISGKAVFSWYNGIKTTEVDKEALQILIKGKPKRGNGQDVEVLRAVLCSVGVEDLPIDKSFTYYPLLLVKSTVAFNDALISWLQSWFDCKISPLILSPKELAWMVAMWSGTVTDPVTKSKPVELFYTLPLECTGITKITYQVDAADCLQLWKSIHQENSDDFTAEEVSLFIKSLENHFYKVFKVKLSAMYLSRIGTSLCYIGSEGRLKIFSGEHAHKILRHLTELSKEQFVGS